MAERLKPIRAPFGQWVGHALRRLGPAIVWLGAAGVVGLLMTRRSGPYELVGIASADRRQIATLSTGRIAAVAVDVLDSVASGQVVAMIDDSVIAAAIETAGAEAARLEAEIDAERARVTVRATADAADLLDDRRRFETDAEDHRSTILALTTELSSDRIELERLGLEMNRFAGLLDDGAVSDQDFDDVRLRHGALAKTIEENERLVALNETNLAASVTRLAAFDNDPERADDPVAARLAPLRLALDVQRKRIGELALERESLILRSPVAGQITQVVRASGEAVRAGDPILVVTAARVETVIAYVDERQAARIAANDEVTLTRPAFPGQTALSRVLRVGPAIELLPDRLWRIPSLRQWGRPIVIASVPEWNLLPGEVVGVQVKP